MPVIQAVILSGGAGSRLWPASRESYPKQLLPLVGERTMLQETALRFGSKPNTGAGTLVICNDAHRFLVAEQLRAIDAEAHIVLEPDGRNTAPAVALAALLAVKGAPNGDPSLLLIMPADHVIEDRQAFLDVVKRGEAAAVGGSLVVFGVVPSSPHTGYGYIEADATSADASPIQSFVEKPDRKTAVALLETNRFFWNSGIFLFRADTYLEELEVFEPDIVAACRESIDKATRDGDFLRPDAAAFARCPANSIDYAVMERTDRGAMVPMTAGWSDVGCWSALYDVSARDEAGNAISGDIVAHDCSSSYLSSRSRLVAAVGLRDLIVVEDSDAVLVAHRDRTQDVRKVVEALRSEGRPEARRHRQVLEPWGSSDDVDSGPGFRVRRLIVNPGASVGAPPEHEGVRHWIIGRGSARVTAREGVRDLTTHDSVVVRSSDCLENTGDGPLHVIEVQFDREIADDS